MNKPGFSFTIKHRAGAARVADFETPHGTVRTPAFVAVGTQATVKGVSPTQLRESGIQLLFANTYHLYLRPGAEIVESQGGLHRFMSWNGPILTDSGGFQVFSLGAAMEHGVGKISNIFPEEEGGIEEGSEKRKRKARLPAENSKPLVKIHEDSVSFKSHLDGSWHELDAEKSMAVQRSLGADMVLAFDECTSPLHGEAYEARALERTHRWEKRSLDYFENSEPLHGYAQALYGIVQGGHYRELRLRSSEFISGNDFDAVAIGGNLGSKKTDMHEIIDWIVPELPENRPRHLLGIGEIGDIFEVVERGVDTFDCVAPTRNARNGGILARTLDGKPLPRFRINIKNARFKSDESPLVEGCQCYACQHFSRAYIHHLFRADEILGSTLATIHNLHFLTSLMELIRKALQEGTFESLKEDWLVGHK